MVCPFFFLPIHENRRIIPFIAWESKHKSQISARLPHEEHGVARNAPAAKIQPYSALLVLAGFGWAALLFAKGRKDGAARGAWLLPTVGAFLLSGTAQCCASIPSYFHRKCSSLVFLPATLWGANASAPNRVHPGLADGDDEARMTTC